MRVTFLTLTLLISGALNASALEAYAEQTSRFETSVREASKTGKLPRISSEQAAGESSRMWQDLIESQQSILAGHYTVEEMISLLEACGKPGPYTQIYLFHNTQTFQESGTATLENSEFTKQVGENLENYKNEITEFSAFAIECFGVLVPLVQTFWDSLEPAEKTDIRANATITVRAGIQQMHQGSLQMISGRILSDENKNKLLDSMLSAAPELTTILSIQDRKDMQSLFTAYESKLSSKYIEKIRLISSTYDNEECSSLCQL